MPASRSASVYADFLLPHLTPAAYVVDVGCGAGELTVDLAPAVRRLVGIDADDAALDEARARARETGLGNATFVTGDAYALGLADGVADVVFAHSVLEALERPAQALAEMLRVLKAGGLVAVASVEYGGLILAGPHEPLLQRFFEIRRELWLREGADPYLGRRLRDLVAGAGFVDVEATTKSISYGTPELVSMFGRGRAEDSVDDWYVTGAIGAELATRSELAAIHDAWLAWSESPAAYLSFAWCRALGRKP